MRLIKSIITVVAMAVISPPVGILNAKASEWGCEVLLCASSTSPSWHGVPACHPPMERLIAAMASWGFSWPTCPEAGTGKPGYEKYADCPAGWIVGHSEVGHGSRSEPNLCVKHSGDCGRRDGCRETASIVRPVRDDPYYFDIPADSGPAARHWFNLRH
ncbi:hypothetical protein FJ970_31315 (plasmid) [Mesorhizobium sp. B2-1-8]|uniref:hypothetical protein n=1 Tax=unclassified Mesorhizobium TaxID=325217 RepID=UPI001127FC15|nr:MULTISPECIES: hypothetical protein [unclassified Mesorhizobium]TPI27669.1 hypothetical protein FJW08_23495 [Mesorhizobium sp. B3-2-1]UCI22870.1 hypothetical protein FJ970_31315 [Mesorhizobium sp. B2-1-8]